MNSNEIVDSTVYGPVVQANDVHGDVNMHTHWHSSAVVAVVELRADPSPFVGRNAEISQVMDVLAGPGGQLVVAGVGGVGKSSLARHCGGLAAERGWFPGGVYWVDLQGYRSAQVPEPADAFTPLLSQLGVPGSTGPDRIARYDQRLRELAAEGRRVLLVFDDVATADQLHGLLPTAGHAAIVTTRDTFRLPGVPQLTLDVLGAADAVTLLDPARGPGVGRLAEVCGHLPLALVIALGLLADEPELTPDALAEQLAETRTPLFAHGHTQLSSVFGTSYTRLCGRYPEAARLLGLLATPLAVNVSAEAAAALAGTSTAEALAHLRLLRQAFLISKDQDRWRLHDLIRRLVADHVAGPDSDAVDRLLAHYAGTARDELAAGLHNLLAALDFTRTAGRLDTFADIAEVVAPHLDERRLYEAALVLREQLVPVRQLLDGMHQGAHAMFDLAVAQHKAEQSEKALHTFEMARAVHGVYDDRSGQARDWAGTGTVLHHLGRLPEAIAAHRTAIELGDAPQAALNWNNLGNALLAAGRLDEAVQAMRQAQEAAQATGDTAVTSRVLGNLSMILQAKREFPEAVACAQEAAALRRAAGDHRGEGKALDHLGLALCGLQRYEEAITAHRAAEQAFLAAEDLSLAGAALNNLGIALMAGGRLTEAVTTYQRAIATQEKVEVGTRVARYRAGKAWNNLGIALHQLGRPSEALAAWLNALEAYREFGDTVSEQRVLGLLTRVATRR